MSVEDAAGAQSISLATAKRRWAFAQASMFREIMGGEGPWT